jgi:hypothetical protein
MTNMTGTDDVPRPDGELTVKIEKFFRTSDGSVRNTDAAETLFTRLKANYAALGSAIAVTNVLSPSIEECLD